MADTEKSKVNYPENAGCTYDACTVIGCQARALLANLRDAKDQADTQARADAIISQAKAMGCTQPLSF